MGTINNNQHKQTDAVWTPGYPESAEKKFYWITVKAASGKNKNEVFLARYNGRVFELVDHPYLFPVLKKHVQAFIAVDKPTPYCNVSPNLCPFCRGVGHYVDDDNVTCFNCDYTISSDKWENRV